VRCGDGFAWLGKTWAFKSYLADAAHVPYRVACLLTQPAGEKSIKPSSSRRAWTAELHDLRRLLEDCASPIMAALDEPALKDLSRWSVAGR
jgi:hypothetical protein